MVLMYKDEYNIHENLKKQLYLLNFDTIFENMYI